MNMINNKSSEDLVEKVRLHMHTILLAYVARSYFQNGLRFRFRHQFTWKRSSAAPVSWIVGWRWSLTSYKNLTYHRIEQFPDLVLGMVKSSTSGHLRDLKSIFASKLLRTTLINQFSGHNELAILVMDLQVFHGYINLYALWTGLSFDWSRSPCWIN